LTVTIKAGRVLDINSGTQITFTQEPATAISNGGGITATVTGTITFAYTNDISSIVDGANLNLFIIAINLNGVLVSRIPSVQESMYPESTTPTVTVFDDDEFIIQNEADNTKKGNYNLVNVTPAQTRTLEWPDHNGLMRTITANTLSFTPTASFDLNKGDVHQMTVTAGSTLEITNSKLGGQYLIIIADNGVGGHTINIG
jgi:hypothetical protein